MISRTVWTVNSDGTLTPELMAVNPESHCRTSKVATISHGPSVRHSHARWASGEETDFPRNFGPPTDDEPFRHELQHRLVLELSVGLSFDQRQAQWRIDLFWLQLQALSARSCRSLARNLHSSGYTQSTCSQGGGPCEGFEKRWRTTTTSVRGV